MYFDAAKTVALCGKLGITINQFMFCYLISSDESALFIQYNVESGGFTSKEIDDVVAKGYIFDNNVKQEAYIDCYVVRESFTDVLNEDIDGDLAMELFDSYPKEINTGDLQFNGRNISPEECEQLIRRKVRNRRITGESDVLQSLEDQKRSGQIKMALKKWIESEQWTVDIQGVAGYGSAII